MFTYMIKRHLEKGGRALVFTHRKELLKQAGGSFNKFGLEAELIEAGSKPDLSLPLHVSMIETFNRRNYENFISTRTLIVIDEAHLNTFNKLFSSFPENCIIIGATATPYRKGKGIPALEDFYEDIVQDIDTPELIELGFLSKAKTYGVKVDLSQAKKKGDDYDLSTFYEENKLYRGVVENWKRICPGSKTILFSSNVDNSIQVCQEFNLNGIDAKHIDGNTPKKKREEILKWFELPGARVICNCGILNAGFDQPDIETVILYRATTSLPLFLQMCGRGSRIAEGKTEFTILDFGNNVSRMKFWEDPREWSLKNDVKRSNKEDAAPIKECPVCGAMLPTSVRECQFCEHEFEKEEKEEEFAELELLPKRDKLRIASGSKLEKKAEMAKRKMISPFWVLHNLEDLQEARKFCELMGYKMPGFEYHNKNRFKVFQDE